MKKLKDNKINEEDAEQIKFSNSCGHAYIRNVGWISYQSREDDGPFTMLDIIRFHGVVPSWVKLSVNRDRVAIRKSEILIDITSANN